VQVIAYNTEYVSSVPHAPLFILLIKDYARLISLGPHGTIITEPIYYNDASYLFDFLIHYIMK